MKRSVVMLAFLLSACGTAFSPVLPTSRDAYLLSGRVRGFGILGFTSWSELKESTVGKAISFCATKNKHATVLSWDTHGVRGWSPLEAELTFTCE